MTFTFKLKLGTYVTLLVASLFLVGCEQAPTQSPYQEGVHYQAVIDSAVIPVAEMAKSLPVVTEFFWYGCPHCRTFATPFEQWLDKKKELVREYIPIVHNEKTELHAKVFFLIKDQPNFNMLHHKMFDLIGRFNQTSSLGEQKVALIKKLNELGISPIVTADAIDTEKYATELANCLQLMDSYEIEGVPTVVVNHQYKVINKAMKTTDEILMVADHLLTLSDI